MSNELIQIKEVKLVPFFTKGDEVDQILARIEAEALAHVPDVSTLKGRNAIKANVTKVTKSKTYLESHGKDLSAEYKAIPKAIDANRKKTRDFLNGLAERVRETLTAWEVNDNAEKAQVIDTEAFLIEYELKHEDGHRDNELFDLKRQQAEAERQAEIKKAADEAKALAEQQAAAKIAQANQDRIDAEQREEAAKQAAIAAAAQAESNRIAQEERAKSDAAEATRREELAQWTQYISEAYAHNDQLIASENARLAEVVRQQDLADQQKRDEAQRQANKQHCAKINTAAMNAFIVAGLSASDAKLAVKALAKNLIPSVTINY